MIIGLPIESASSVERGVPNPSCEGTLAAVDARQSAACASVDVDGDGAGTLPAKRRGWHH